MNIDNLLKLITTALQIPSSSGIKINVHPDKLPDYDRNIRGTFSRANRQVDIGFVSDPQNPWPGNIRTVIHEIAHAQQLHALGETNKLLGIVGSDVNTIDKMLLNDLVAQGKLKPDQERDYYVNYLKGITTVAKELGMPSSNSGRLEEVRANIVANSTAAAFGLPQDKKLAASVEKLREKHPEFVDWVESGLGGQFLGSPRLKSFTK